MPPSKLLLHSHCVCYVTASIIGAKSEDNPSELTETQGDRKKRSALGLQRYYYVVVKWPVLLFRGGNSTILFGRFNLSKYLQIVKKKSSKNLLQEKETNSAERVYYYMNYTHIKHQFTADLAMAGLRWG